MLILTTHSLQPPIGYVHMYIRWHLVVAQVTNYMPLHSHQLYHYHSLTLRPCTQLISAHCMGQQVAIVIELVATCACVATYTHVLASLPGHSVGVERRPGMDMNCLNMHNNCPHLCQTSHDLWEFHFYICLLSNRATALYAHTPVLPCDIHTPLHTLLFDAPSLCPPHGHPYKYNSLLPKQTASPLIPAHPIPELPLPPVHVSFPTHFYMYPPNLTTLPLTGITSQIYFLPLQKLYTPL